ncbi:MAG: ammonium transporter [Bacillota bacterium]|nr:ammonium transporter [Bacillota bacterium]
MPSSVNGVDTLFVIISSALVLLMTPALALFYGGMVRRKNVLSTTMHSYASIAIVSIQWVLIGYTLAFGPDFHGIVGGLNWFGLNGVGINPNPDYAATIPHQVYMIFQLMFAIITPALISGSYAERMRFSAFLAFTLLWTTFIYDPVAHWVWGTGGWIRNLGALDFAGGNVVHVSSGVSALVAAIVLGKRRKGKAMKPHNLPMTVLGAGLLWFGWFGFNAGSALAVNGVAINAFLTTNTSAAAAAIAWLACEWFATKKPTVLGVASGAVSGLVAITPGAGYVTPLSAILIGLIGGSICFFSVSFMKQKLGYDDALDAFGCHGVGGTWGGIATGIFASASVNQASADALKLGRLHLIGVQVLSIVAIYAYAAVVTFVILKLVNLVFKLRVSKDEEDSGIDISVHGEEAYGDFASEGGIDGKYISA